MNLGTVNGHRGRGHGTAGRSARFLYFTMKSASLGSHTGQHLLATADTVSVCGLTPIFGTSRV